MPKKQKSVKKSSLKNKKLSPKKKKIEKFETPIVTPNITALDIKKPIIEEVPKKSKLRKVLKIIWFSFGILDLIWTVLWLIYSLSNTDSYGLIGVVFFAAGFYIFCFFILTTLIYYIIKMAMRISKQNG
jgi:hypothetical protein